MDTELSIGIYCAGLDALTFTTLAGTDESHKIDDLMGAHIADDNSNGNDVGVRTIQGFAGVGTKHLFMGNRDKFNLYEARTGYADEIAEQVKAAGLTIKPTRTDWAVTFAQREEASKYAGYLRQFVKDRHRGGGVPKPGRSALYETDRSADTLYIYTGDKSIMHRTYNKAAESPGEWPKDAWRHETQFRHKRARGAFTQFLQSPGTGWLARSFVSGFLMQYGIVEDWMKDTQPCAAPSKMQRSDTAKRLEWFLSCAVPVVGKLVAAGIRSEPLVEAMRNVGLEI